MRPVILDYNSQAFSNLPLYVHFPAYYQAEHGGFLGFSFARYSIELMRYRSGVDMGMEEDAEWNRPPFDPARELPSYDCLIARAAQDAVEPPPFHEPSVRAQVELSAHAGRFWVYRRSQRHGAGQ